MELKLEISRESFGGWRVDSFVNYCTKWSNLFMSNQSSSSANVYTMTRNSKNKRQRECREKRQEGKKPEKVTESQCEGSEGPRISHSLTPNAILKAPFEDFKDRSEQMSSKLVPFSSRMVLERSSFQGTYPGQVHCNCSSSFCIPRPLRNQQLNFSSKVELPSKSNSEIYGWTPWDSFDFCSDLLKSLKSDKDEKSAKSTTATCKFDRNPLNQWQNSQFERVHLLGYIGEVKKREQRSTLEVSESVETWLSLSPSRPQSSPSPSKKASTYSKVLKCLVPPEVNTPTLLTPAVSNVFTPKICIASLRQFNFTNVPIQFSIHVENLPKSIVLNPDIFEVAAYTPSEGQKLLCHIRYGSTKGSFLGCFIANDEVGEYRVTAAIRLNRFMKRLCKSTKEADMSLKFGDFSSTINILVNRNYYRQSLKVPSNLFQLDVKRSCPTDVTNSWGIACDKRTNQIYYTESSSNYISCVDPFHADGKMIFRMNSQGPRSYQSGAPTGICCDEHHGRLIVCERDSQRVSFFALNTGEYITSFGMFGIYKGMFNTPWDVAISPCGNYIAVTDLGNNRIQSFDFNGNFLGECYHENPLGISFDATEGHHIYVTGWNTGTVTEFSRNFQSCRNIVSREDKLLRFPQGLVTDSTGSVLVADTRNKCIRHLASAPADEDGKQLLSTMSKVGGVQIKAPANLAMMRNGLVALLEENGKVHLF